MPVRKIPKNYRNVTGIAAHGKADGPAAFESTLERDFIELLEFDPSVVTFEVQPITLDWRDDDGAERHYTPDVLVTLYGNDGANPSRILYEVKYRSELKRDWANLRPKFKAAIHYAKANGWRFKLVTEVEIRTPYLQNARFLLHFLRQAPPSTGDQQRLLVQLSCLEQTTPTDLLAALSDDQWEQARLLPVLWYLVASQNVDADLEQALTMDSSIRGVSPCLPPPSH